MGPHNSIYDSVWLVHKTEIAHFSWLFDQREASVLQGILWRCSFWVTSVASSHKKYCGSTLGIIEHSLILVATKTRKDTTHRWTFPFSSCCGCQQPAAFHTQLAMMTGVTPLLWTYHERLSGCAKAVGRFEGGKDLRWNVLDQPPDLEDHPRTCKWLITHGDRKSPKDWVVGPLPKCLKWLVNGGY